MTTELESKTLQEWLEERRWKGDDLAFAMEMSHNGVKAWLNGGTPTGRNRRLALKVLKLKDGQIRWGEVKGG